MITKSDLESSDSFLAQGGICVLTDENDYDNYFEDKMKEWMKQANDRQTSLNKRANKRSY